MAIVTGAGRGIGAAQAAFDEACRYSQMRIMFDKPIARFQLVQNKLVWMANEITKAQLMCWKLGKMKEAGAMQHFHAVRSSRGMQRLAAFMHYLSDLARCTDTRSAVQADLIYVVDPERGPRPQQAADPWPRVAGKTLLEMLGASVIEGAAIVDLPELGGSDRIKASGLMLRTE